MAINGPRWSDLDHNNQEFESKQFKIVLMGDGAVGKTSICQRFIKEDFANAYKQTIGLDFYAHRITIPTKKGKTAIALQIWDIGGQSIGSKMVKKYIYGAHAVLLCYDITNMQTFLNLTEWLELVRQTFKDNKMPYIALLGNKTDMIHLRAIVPQKHYNFCDKHNAIGYFLSARTGENIVQTFYRISAELSGVTLGKVQIQTMTKAINAAVINDYAQNNPYEKTVQQHVNNKKTTKKCIIQ